MAGRSWLVAPPAGVIPAKSGRRGRGVGWVERSDTHQLRVCEDDGFRDALNPSCALLGELWTSHTKGVDKRRLLCKNIVNRAAVVRRGQAPRRNERAGGPGTALRGAYLARPHASADRGQASPSGDQHGCGGGDQDRRAAGDRILAVAAIAMQRAKFEGRAVSCSGPEIEMALNGLESRSFPGARLIAAAAIGGSLFIYLYGFVLPSMKDATKVTFQMVCLFLACYALFFLVALVSTAVSLFVGRWIVALYCFVASCIGIMSIYGSLALKGGLMAAAAPHREIAEIYNRRRPELTSRGPMPRLVDLDDQCGPPAGCECWLLLDLDHFGGVEKDIGGWHRPIASVFLTNSAAEHFAIVNVKRIDPDAYSVLGCEWDPAAWWLR